MPGVKFVKGFLQHVLPKGFRKVRHYGRMASNSQTTLDRDDELGRSHHLSGAVRSCDQISRQRIMNTHRHPASGVASARRYNLAPLMTIVKTRITRCRIAVRADIKMSRPSKEKRRHFAAIGTSLSADLNRVLSLDAVRLRFTAHWRLKTDDSRRSCGLLFPYATRRRSTTGLLEQMP